MYRNNNRGQWQGAPYANAPAYAPYHNQPMPQFKKHSGAKTKRYTPKQGPNKGVEMIHTHGWTAHKRKDFITYSCNTTGKSKQSDKGWIGSIAVEVLNHNTGQKSFYWGTMEAKTSKVVINDLGLVINPKARNGGYTGTFINKRR
ncbi:hypothetical protein [Flavobacterium coralii]|uniref:hypothetical protein n=1 Tax=Flavobacterium coralii TaxID=2838017 RepID=UPI000C6582F9|nr:hypothetical protein [Flavobacterium sp.]|tara:strand:+ start:41776 stop:42210 length:435 start_codon:yes stop_codon:yes gene_type:complete